jgi:RHS repeat-associated protein
MRPIFLSAFLLTAAIPAAAGSWTSGTYIYDGSGNITSIGTDIYRYDAFGRLKTSTARTPANANAQTFTYDPDGNLKLIETVGGVPLYVPVNPATNHIDGTGTPPPGSTVVSATYDEAGNQTSLNGAYTYTYDALGMMTTLTSGSRVEQYLYDADDQRIATVYGGTPQRWRYTLRDLEGRFVREYVDEVNGQTHSWRWTRDYLYADGRLLATIVASDRAGGESRQHFHLDHLGTPRLITDDGGNLLSRHTLQPFGPEALGSARDSEVIKFTGHERDYAGAGDTNDLDYMHARYYGPGMGRFLSVDSALDSKANMPEPQRWNRYAYVTNNPLKYSDPDGRERLQRYHFKNVPVNDSPSSPLRMPLFAAGVLFGGPLLRAGWQMALGFVLGNPQGARQAVDIALSPPNSSAMPTTPPSKGEIPAGSLAGKCVECAKTELAAIPGSTLVSGAFGKGTHYAVETAEGVIVDRSLRDNLQAMGAKYDDIPVDKTTFTRKEWEGLLQRVTGEK